MQGQPSPGRHGCHLPQRLPSAVPEPVTCPTSTLTLAFLTGKVRGRAGLGRLARSTAVAGCGWARAVTLKPSRLRCAMAAPLPARPHLCSPSSRTGFHPSGTGTSARGQEPTHWAASSPSSGPCLPSWQERGTGLSADIRDVRSLHASSSLSEAMNVSMALPLQVPGKTNTGDLSALPWEAKAAGTRALLAATPGTLCAMTAVQQQSPQPHGGCRGRERRPRETQATGAGTQLEVRATSPSAAHPFQPQTPAERLQRAND